MERLEGVLSSSTCDTFLQISKMIEIFSLMVLNGDVFLWAALIKHHYMFIWRPDSAIWQKLNSELEKNQYAVAQPYIKTSR